jgi:hypothetical protein
MDILLKLGKKLKMISASMLQIAMMGLGRL